MAKILPLYGKAAVLTVRIGVLGIFFAILTGLLCSVIRQKRIPVLRQLTSVYIELSRNTPLLVQLFFIYYDPDGSGNLRNCRTGLPRRKLHGGSLPERPGSRREDPA